MKKQLIMILAFFIVLTGCNKPINKELEEAALTAYVNNYNKIVESESFNVDLDADIKAPKSLMNAQSLQAKLKANFLFNIKQNLFDGNLTLKNTDLNNDGNDLNLKIPIAYKDEIIYFKLEDEKLKKDQWTKIKLDDYNQDGDIFSQQEKIDIKQAKDYFENLRDIQYNLQEIDGNKFYEIQGNLSITDLIKTFAKDNDEDANEYLNLAKDLKVQLSILVPQKNEGNIKAILNIKVDSTFAQVSINNLKINTQASNKKVEIDTDIEKNAVELYN